MTVQEYVEQKMEQYSEAFDFYMDVGEMPEDMPMSDTLCGYMKAVIDDNPQLDSQDPLWKELLKDDLMKFLEAMLSLFIPIEQEYRKQWSMIATFANADMDGKRAQWGEVYQVITENYPSQDVNINGYAEQIKENQQNPEVVDAALTSLTKDWAKANREQKLEKEQQLLERHKDKWERLVKEHGLSDYRQAKKVDNVYHRYPALKEIVTIMGREQPQNKEEQDDIVLKYQPILLSAHTSCEEVEQISVGKDLNHLIPSETALLSEKATETLFYQKYATGQLQLFANRLPMKAQKKSEQQRKEKPRLQMGPIIVGVDTSGSMSGRPEQLAKTLLLQLLRMAKKKKRKCFLITFSVRAQAIDLAHPANWRKLNDFMTHGFTGGTDGEDMLRIALEQLRKEDYALADALIISDFYFALPMKHTLESLQWEHDKGARFYGLQIGKQSCIYEKVLDKVWRV